MAACTKAPGQAGAATTDAPSLTSPGLAPLPVAAEPAALDQVRATIAGDGRPLVAPDPRIDEAADAVSATGTKQASARPGAARRAPVRTPAVARPAARG